LRYVINCESRTQQEAKKVFDEDNSQKLDPIEINGKFLSRQLGEKSVVRPKYNVKRSLCWGTAPKKATEKRGEKRGERKRKNSLSPRFSPLFSLNIVHAAPSYLNAWKTLS